MKLRHLTGCLSLLVSLSTWGQPLWEMVMDPIGYNGCASTALFTNDGRLFASIGESGNNPFFPAKLIEIDPESGEVLASITTSMPNRTSPMVLLLGQAADGHLLGYSPAYVQNSGAGDSVRMVHWRFSTDLDQFTPTLVGKAGKGIGFMAGFIAPDSTIRIVYSTADWAGNTHQFEALKLNLNGDSITSRQLYNGMSQGAVTSLAMHPDGRMVMGSSYADWGYVPTSGGNVSYLEEDFTIDSTYYLEPVDENNPSPLLDAPQNPIQVLPLASGNLLISGQFYRDFSVNHPAVIQRTDPQAHVISQYVHDSPWEKDMPAVIQTMDLAGDGTLYFAQMNNWNGNANILSQVPSQVEVTHLDTSLNVLGRYVFDGYADSVFYMPYSIQTTPDGGVLVMGKKHELSISGATIKAWIAKLGPESFTAIQETSPIVLQLYPNPGREGFTLNLKQHLVQGRVQLHDMQGRLVLDQALDGINIHVSTPDIGAGLYTVTLQDASGTVLQSLRWAKL